MKTITNDILREFEERLGRANPRERRIAVFGPQSSGKTCYFASLYGRSTGDGVAANFDHDPDTADYMGQCWQEYQTGVPAATGKLIPTKLRFQLTHEETGRLWTVEMLDHAGELIQKLDRAKALPPQDQAGEPPAGAGYDADDDAWLRDLVTLWLRECEAILIFLDVSDSRSEELQKRRAEVGRLLSLCSEYSQEDRRLTRPLALVLSKWDCRSAINRDDPKWEENQARLFLAEDPDFRQIFSLIGGFGQTVALFPVSAFGSGAVSLGFDARGRQKFKPAKAKPDPYNLLPPLVWAVQQSDKRRLAEAERLTAERPAAIDAQVEAFETLIGRDGITNGPVHDAARARLRELYAKRGARRRRRVLASAALALVLVGAGLIAARQKAGREYEAVRDFRAVNTEPADMAARADRGRKLLDGAWSWFLGGDRTAEVAAWVEQDDFEARKFREEDGVAKLRVRERAAGSLDDVLALANDAEAFLRDFKAGKHEAEAGAILSRSRARAAALGEQYTRYKDYQDREPAKDLKAAVAHWQHYLKSAPAPVDELRVRATNHIADLRRSDEEQTWKAVAAYARNNIFDFEGVQRRARDYLRDYARDGGAALYAEDANRLLASNASRWGKAWYNEIRNMASKTEVESLRKAAQRAEQYLNEAGGPPDKVMGAHVRRWKGWFDQLAAGTDLSVSLVSITANPDTDWWSDTNLNKTYFIAVKAGVRVGGTDRAWDKWSDNIPSQAPTPFMGTKTHFKNQENFGGMFRYKFGDDAEIRVIAYQYLGSNKTATFPVSSGQCLPVLLQKDVQLKDGKNYPVVLKFDCPAGRAPDLPDYTTP